ncbi:uncharacterized protein LOC135696309 isoform X2 [Rhopilema esculentum]|uniref:uncharacterized protein LOC135696309 isoform X2 n=1 Tax=Rhopilema esculentum TaxID=499914 RepID=UPI0031D60F91
MFSELVQGSCSWDGSLEVEKGLCSYPSVKRAVSSGRIRQVRSVSSSSTFTRPRNASLSTTFSQSESRLSELVLPKTYVTKTGLLLLFAVIDDELFALVDSSNKGKKCPSRKGIFGDNAELLSEFKSLEQFVLSVLEYQHRKEKNLYASANKRLFRFGYQAKYHYKSFGYKQRVEDVAKRWDKEKTQAKTTVPKEDETDQSVMQASMVPSVIGTAGGSSADDNRTHSEEKEPKCAGKEDFERLALPANDVMRVRGKLRSPRLERKITTRHDSEETPTKEYFMISSKFDGGKNEQDCLDNSPRGAHSAMTTVPHLKHFKREFLYSIRGYSNNSNDNNDNNDNNNNQAIPSSVKRLIQNFNENQLKAFSNYESAAYYKDERWEVTSPPGNGTSNILPFMFDQESSAIRGHSALPRSRQSSAFSRTDYVRSPRVGDLKNAKLHPTSPKQVRETRVLGVTPSAISLTSEEFARLIEVKSADKFSLNLPVNYGMDDFQFLNSKTMAGDKVEAEKTTMQNVDNQTPETSLHADGMKERSSQTEAGQTTDLDSDSNESVSEKRLAGSFIGSLGSFIEEDNDDDRILFSYISPSLRKGSWNPMISFSLEGSSDLLMEGSFSGTEQSEVKTPEYEMERDLSAESKSTGDVTKRKGLGNLDGSSAVINSNLVGGDIHHSGLTNSVGASSSRKNASASPEEILPNQFLSSLDSSKNICDLSEMSNVRSSSGKPLSCDSEPNNHTNKKDTYIENSYNAQSAGKSEQKFSSSSAGMENLLPFHNEAMSPQGNKSSTLVGETEKQNYSEILMAVKEDVCTNGDGNQIGKSTHNAVDAQRQGIHRRQSSFISNSGTVVSVRDSIPDLKQINDNDPFTHRVLSTYSGSSFESLTQENSLPSVWICQSAKEGLNKESKDLIDSQTESEDNESKTVIGNLTKTDPLALADSALPEDVVDKSFKKKPNSQKLTDPISKELTKTQGFAFVENSVFGARQMVKSSLADKSEIDFHSPFNKKVLKDNTNVKEIASLEPTYEEGLIGKQRSLQCSAKDTADSKESLQKVDKSVVDLNVMKKQNPHEVKEMQPSQKPAKERKDEGYKRESKPERQTTEKRDKQTVELKIDLKVTGDSSPENGTIDLDTAAVKPANNVNKTELPSKETLRLDGVSEGEIKRESQNLEDLKLLLQQNKPPEDTTKLKKKLGETAPLKRNAGKAKKKRGMASRQGSISKKGTDSKNLSPVLDLPKKMETVETMIGRPNPSDNPMKPSPDTESEVIIEREITFENQLEQKETAASKNVRIQNVEVKKVSEVDPEKKGAYPPSRTKRGKKASKKATVIKEQPEDKLRYEEQMKLLHEKEVEQQKAREAAVAKQKLLEEERERYRQEEELAKIKEEEARKNLAEAKIKAKEEREAKRLADAEKKRQLVEQRREERRQKETEIAEKEKEAERLKHEKERRAIELKEQRERLKEQERMEEEQLLEKERWEEMKREEEERRREEERIRKAQEELERLIEEREYREQLRRVAEVQEAKMREVEDQRRLQEEEEQKRIADERERLKRAEYLKLQAELERQKEAEIIANERRQMMLVKAAKRKAELLKRREENLQRMFDLKCKRSSQGISRSFTFTYFVHIPRSVWEVPIGWSNKKSKSGARGKSRPISVSASMKSTK